MISVLKGGDTDTGSVSVTDGNKNEALGQKIADYFRNNKWVSESYVQSSSVELARLFTTCVVIGCRCMA